MPPAWLPGLRSASAARRARALLTNGANSLALPLVGPFFSLLVVRLASVELWGQFVPLLVAAQLAAHVAGWGNKEYLLREFSLHPSRLARDWQSSLFTRLALLALFPLLALGLGLTPARAGLLLLGCLGLMLAQNYDVIVLYRRDFAYSLAVQAAGLALLAAPVTVLGPRLTLDALLAIFAASNLARAVLLFLRYRGALAAGWHGRFNPRQLGDALPFFLLGLSGMLQSRVDQYFVAFSQSESQIALYHVFSNIMLYGQSVSAIVLAPFVKSLYRLPAGAALKMAARLALFGVLLLAVFLPAAYLALVVLYRMPVPPAFMLLGGLIVLPVYLYLPVIYRLFRAGQPGRVIAVNLSGTALNAVLLVILLPRFGLSGALAATAATQCAVAAAYWVLAAALPTVQQETPHVVPELPRTD